MKIFFFTLLALMIFALPAGAVELFQPLGDLPYRHR